MAVSAVAPQVSGSRGDRLFAALVEGGVLGPAERVLAEEAGRLADRLDRLDRHLQGREWLRFDPGEYEAGGAVEIVVRVDQVLAEARQQQAVLKQIVGELRQSAASRKPGRTSDSGPASGEAAGRGGGIAAIVAKRRITPSA